MCTYPIRLCVTLLVYFEVHTHGLGFGVTDATGCTEETEMAEGTQITVTLKDTAHISPETNSLSLSLALFPGLVS